jgi:hypothetical protein
MKFESLHIKIIDYRRIYSEDLDVRKKKLKELEREVLNEREKRQGEFVKLQSLINAQR